MPRKTFAAVLPFLAVLALLSPGKAVAGPPEQGPAVFAQASSFCPLGCDSRQANVLMILPGFRLELHEENHVPAFASYAVDHGTTSANS